MGLQIKYHNARQAAYAVHEELVREGRRPLSARPWNKYDPDNTLWWLVPSTDWPAYKHGKMFFCQKRASKGHLFCGLHIEKGFDPIVESAYPFARGRRLIMGSDWVWFDFLSDLDANRVSSTIAQASLSMTSARP